MFIRHTFKFVCKKNVTLMKECQCLKWSSWTSDNQNECHGAWEKYTITHIVCHGSQRVKKDFKDIYVDICRSECDKWFSQFGE